MPRLLFYIILVLLPALVAAQNRKYVFTRLSMKDGLASNHVYCILQDKKGFMWFGTANGLQRYDGRKTVMFRSSMGAEKYLPPVGISQIFQDSTHNFWVRSANEVGIFDPVTFHYRRAIIKTDREPPPRAEYFLWQDSKGNIFLIITKYGVLVYDSATNTFHKDESRIKTPSGWSVRILQEDPRTGHYWMGADSGLAVFNPASKTLYHHRNNPWNWPILKDPRFVAPVTALFIDRRDRFWMATWKAGEGERFHCYDRSAHQLLPDTEGLNVGGDFYRELHRFSQQSNGRLWAFGRMMLLEYDSLQHRFHYIRDEHIDDYGIKYDAVHCIYEDREQNIWLGTDEGIYIFNPGRQLFNSIGLLNHTGDNIQKELSVNSLLQTNNRQLLVGTWGLGTLSYDSNFIRIPNNILDGAPRNDDSYKLQWDLHEEKRTGMIWFGCQHGRIILYDPPKKHAVFHNLPVLEQTTVRQVIEDQSGNIWLATQYGHLVKWDRETGYGPRFLKGFSLMQHFNTIVYKLRIDRDGFLWVCTHNKGLYKVDPVSGAILAHYDTKKGPGKSLYADMVSDIVQYNDSLFFVGTGALNLLNQYTGHIRKITTDDGLPSVNSTSLELDNDGNLWIGLLNGICRYNHRRKIFTLFTQKDGIIGSNFELNASLKLRNGNMVFGNSHDFVFFQPGAVYSSSPPLDVSITDFKLFNTYLPPDSIMKLDKVRLKHTENSITIEFAALSFLQRDKTVYYYMLEGIDKTWIRADHGLYANYALLPPGHYTFKIMCENADGMESKNITTLRIQVEPPFYRTWWFLSLIGIGLAGLVYLIHRIRVNRLLTMEKVRTRIARDLHDDMGSTLSTINILSEMAKMKIAKDAAKTSEYLNKISDNSSRMMEAMDDIVWSINPMNDSMQRITARMREFATGVLEARNIEFSFRVDEQVADLKLDMEARRDFFLVFKEALNNLAKYSQCRYASIGITIQKHKLLMKIQDNGIGFDVNNADSGNGLINMRKRAQSLGGQLLISSDPATGTKVMLEVPLT